MFTQKKLAAVLAIVMIATLALSACTQPTPVTVYETVTVEVPADPVIVTVTAEPTDVVAPPVDRRGAWLDTIVVIEEPNTDQAITRLETGEIDLFANTVSNPETARTVSDSPALDGYLSYGSYNELSFNPVGPIFEGTGKLNPFAVARVREAMNWLIDRNYIAQEIMGGLGSPRWTPFNNASSDYAAMADVIRGLEFQYAYNRDLAQQVIAEEMETLGATLVDGKWQYDGAPVEISILIRTEDERRDIGDYVGNQLEDIGFTVIRDYKTAADASPIWLRGNPADGLFHIYTGGWITTAVPRNLADNFLFFYTDMGMAVPLWMAYENDPEFYELADRLDRSDYQTPEERRDMLARALELSFYDSNRIWLADRGALTPKRTEVRVAADLYGAVSGSWLWPVTIQREGQIGGSMTIAMPSILTEPWNPLDGSNWIFDMMLIRATGEMAALPNPFTGLYMPQRIERAEVVVQTGTPIIKTLDWVSLDFEDSIEVPGDAWVDWDAEEQRFLTASEVYTETQTAVRKSVVYYEADLFETSMWHDGSPMSIGDFVMGMIVSFDRAKEASLYYDEAKVPAFNSFMAAFRGVRIISENPLIIETYSDTFQPDAENSVSDWFPYFLQGEGSWHMLTLGLMAEAEGQAAFSSAKADTLEVERLSYIAGPTIDILKAQLDAVLESGEIPYAPTMGQYVDAAEIQTRFENYAEWFRRRNHFWIGTGPFYLERAFPIEGTVVLQRNRDYPDMADKWMSFAEAPIADVELDGPGRVSIGTEAVYDVFVNLPNGDPYAIDDIDNVKFLVFDASGAVVEVAAATAVEDGLWQVTLSADVTGKLAAGSNRLEVVVVSKLVAVPSFDAMTFVTAP